MKKLLLKTITTLAILTTTIFADTQLAKLTNTGQTVDVLGYKEYRITLWAQQSGLVTRPGFFATYSVVCNNCVTAGTQTIKVKYNTKNFDIKYQNKQTLRVSLPIQERTNGRSGREFYTVIIYGVK